MSSTFVSSLYLDVSCAVIAVPHTFTFADASACAHTKILTGIFRHRSRGEEGVWRGQVWDEMAVLHCKRLEMYVQRFECPHCRQMQLPCALEPSSMFRHPCNAAPCAMRPHALLEVRRMQVGIHKMSCHGPCAPCSWWVPPRAIQSSHL